MVNTWRRLGGLPGWSEERFWTEPVSLESHKTRRDIYVGSGTGEPFVLSIIELLVSTSSLEFYLFMCLLLYATGHNGRSLWHHSVFLGRVVRSPVLVQSLDSQWDSHPSNMWRPPRWWCHVVVWRASGTSWRADWASFWALSLKRNIEFSQAKQ